MTKRVGRPKKSEVDGKRPVGRPKGEKAIMDDYKRRMLASPKSRRVLESVFNAALDDEHRHQASAWKLVLDRIAPISNFESEIKRDGGKSSVQINITGLTGTSTIEDGEFTEISEPVDEQD